MDKDNERFDQKTTASTQAWLNSYREPTAQQPKKPLPKLVIGVIAVIGIVIMIGISILLYANNDSDCLTVTDYKNLTKTEYTDELNPSDDFYSFNIKFDPGSSDYSDVTEQAIVTVDRLGQYFANQQDKPIIITLTAVYAEGGSVDLAADRLAKVRADLTIAGIADSSITTGNPVVFPVEELDDASEGYIILSVVSVGQCQ